MRTKERARIKKKAEEDFRRRRRNVKRVERVR